MMSQIDRLTEQLFDDQVSQKPDPYELFTFWLEDAKQKEVNDPTAMSVATVDAHGLPNVRMVLCNAHDSRGLVFFTNANSAKGQELEDQPKAALLFHWKSVRRQVRLRGPVQHVTDAEADAYFASRPRGSQVGAHASNQSHQLENRQQLIERVAMFEAKFEGEEVPRPEYWKGYRVIPHEWEFWQNGEFRLHNRIRFERETHRDEWQATRLNP